MNRIIILSALAFVTGCSWLPLCTDDPAAKRCIGTEEVDPPAPDPSAAHPKGLGESRFWENRDAGSCVSAIPVYGVGECDCNTGKVCGDGCGPTGNVEVFCVCGGLKEEKRAATWQIPGFDARYPQSECK